MTGPARDYLGQTQTGDTFFLWHWRIQLRSNLRSVKKVVKDAFFVKTSFSSNLQMQTTVSMLQHSGPEIFSSRQCRMCWLRTELTTRRQKGLSKSTSDTWHFFSARRYSQHLLNHLQCSFNQDFMLSMTSLSRNSRAEPQDRHATASELRCCRETCWRGTDHCLNEAILTCVGDEWFRLDHDNWLLGSLMVTVVCPVSWTVRSSWCVWHFFVDINVRMTSTEPPTCAGKQNSCHLWL